MKRFLCVLLILALLVPAALAESGAKLEGPGYDTPEAAVLAYLDGLNAGDAQAMLSTFAYESLADHANPRAFLERMQTFIYNYTNAVPLTGDYARSLMTSARYGKLAGYLANQFIELSAHLEGKNEILRDSAAIDALMDKFDQSPVNGWQGHVEFVRWISPAALTDKYALPQNMMNIALQTEYAGADDVAELAAQVRLNGVDAVQGMQCVRYGDRWYNLDMFTILSAILGLDSFSAGMAFPKDEDEANALRTALNPSANFEQQTLLTLCASSALAGTRWQLSSLNGADAVVAEAAEAAASGANAVYGELRIHRTGGALVNLRFSADLADALGADGGRAKVALAWADVLGTLGLRGARAWHLELSVDDMQLRRNGDTLVFTLDNGIEAVFRQMA